MKKILLILAILLTGCVTQKQQPKILITHVLAVTEQGDTLRLPINMIKPNVYYKVINYGNDYYRPYYNHWDYQHRPYNNNIYVQPNNSNNNSNKSIDKFKDKDISRIEDKIKIKEIKN